MIKANELRIGNYISHGSDDIIIVTNLSDNGYAQMVNYMPLSDYDYRPIPLTEQWLLDFGFESYPHFTIPNNKYIDLGRNRRLTIGCVGTPNEMIFLRDISEDGLKIEDIVCLRNFDYDGKTYVHDLQNIFHSIKQEELTLKQPII